MKILSIETSCDETAVSIVKIAENGPTIDVSVLSHIVSSQIEMHKEWGGVVPSIAKREHQKNLFPILVQALKEAGLYEEGENLNIEEQPIKEWLKREPDLTHHIFEDLPKIKIPEIDIISVTSGPGLEPALWVGLNFAKTLSLVWQKPIVPTNHMAGHIFSGLLQEGDEKNFILEKPEFPALALLISGGHTEIVKMNSFDSYELLGQTRDDAVGEAFDKAARVLGLPYPGGPEISHLASQRQGDKETEFPLPRPMINSDDFDFSFSGLKTAVLYKAKEAGELSDNQKIELAYQFEEAVTEVLTSKVKKALEETGSVSLVVGGGVIANKRIRKSLSQIEGIKLYLPSMTFTTDNATMIALAGYFHNEKNGAISPNVKDLEKIVADGNLKVHG